MSKKSVFIICSILLLFLAIFVGVFFSTNKNDIIITISSNINIDNITVKSEKGAKIDLNNYNVSVDGYEFIGYYNNNSLDYKIDNDYILTADKTIYAYFSKIVNINDINKIDDDNTYSYTIITADDYYIDYNEINKLLNTNIQRLDLSKCKFKYLELSNNIFSNSKIKELVLPYNIEVLKENSFYNCNNLKTLVLPKNLKIIESKAINYCLKLDNIKFNNELLEIKSNAIQNCLKLENLNLPSSINKIEENFIFDCDNLKEINVNKDNIYYISDDGILYSSDYKNLIKYPPNKNINIVLNKNTENIYNYAFYNSKINNIVFNKNIKSVGVSAFENCKYLKNIDINSDNIYELKDSCFKNCINIDFVKLGKGLIKIEDSVFENCKNLETVEIINSLVDNNFEYIGNSVFQECFKLKSINIPDSVKSLGKNLFYNCQNLKNVTIGIGVKILPNNIFYNCKNLEIINIQNINKVENYSFYNCQNLKQINGINSVMNLGNYVFYNCKKLENLNMENVLYLGSSNFENCISLKDINLQSIESLTENLFYNCYNLEKLKLGKNLKIIEDNSLINCSKLEIELVNNTNYNIVDNLILSNDNKILYWFNNQNTVTIPKETQQIYNYCLNGKDKLKNINVEQGNLYFKANNGLLIDNNNYLIVYPSGIEQENFETLNIEGLKKYSIQSKYLKNITISENVNYIENGSIFNTENLEEIQLPFLGENKNDINACIGYIFCNDYLEYEYKSNLYLPKKLENISVYNQEVINDKAFYNASNIKQITIGEKTKIINNYVFYGCLNLLDLKIEGCIDYIGDYFIEKSNNLKNLYIGFNNDLKLSKNVFKSVNKLNLYVLYNQNIVITNTDKSNFINKFVDCYMYSRNWNWSFIPVNG